MKFSNKTFFPPNIKLILAILNVLYTLAKKTSWSFLYKKT